MFTSVPLPSKLKPYDGITEVKVRPFIGKDEELLATISWQNLEKRLAEVFNQTLQGIRAEELTLGDRLYLVIWQAIHSYSKDYTVEITCEHCFHEFETEIDLSTLEVIELPDDFKEPISLDIMGKEVKVRLLRVKDEIAVQDWESRGKSGWLYRFARTIVSDQDIMEKLRFLEELPTREVAKIRAVQEQYNHGPKMEVPYTCPNCGGTGIAPVPFRLTLLLPAGSSVTKSFRG